MTNEELLTISSLPNAAIIAPAGHGKTEMIADIVEHSSRRQLLLTHTNAGVDAISKRLKKRNISKDKYTVTTIAAFCIKWCLSYDNSSHIDKTLSPLEKSQVKKYYEQMYSGAKSIFECQWAGKVLCATYGGVIVDEYQDCVQEQYEIFVSINRFLPVIVLGDPMQGIFSFAGKLVDWNTLPFTLVDVKTRPWRWAKANPQLGDYFSVVRSSLSPILDGKSCSIEIDSCNGSIEIIAPDKFNGYSLLKEFKQYENIVMITQWSNKQLQLCSQMPGFFQYDETQECNELFEFAEMFDSKSDAELYYAILKFVHSCATGVTAELASYIKRLQNNSFDFSRITKHSEFGELLFDAKGETKLNGILKILNWFDDNSSLFKLYRAELFYEMIRSIKFAYNNDTSIFDAANRLRKDVSLQKRYSDFKYLSSRTLLSKGLEFDCVIIDMTTPLSAKDFYVAMTRAMKKIYIISNSNKFSFSK